MRQNFGGGDPFLKFFNGKPSETNLHYPFDSWGTPVSLYKKFQCKIAVEVKFTRYLFTPREPLRHEKVIKKRVKMLFF